MLQLANFEKILRQLHVARAGRWFMVGKAHLPWVSKQLNRVPVEDEARSDIRLMHRFRIEDEAPKFSMIYYDNDQFRAEDIYYLRWGGNRTLHFVLHN